MNKDPLSHVVSIYAGKAKRKYPSLDYDEVYNTLWIAGAEAQGRYDGAKGTSLSTWLHANLKHAAGRLVYQLLPCGQHVEYDDSLSVEPVDLDVVETMREVAQLPAIKSYLVNGSSSIYAARHGKSRMWARRELRKELNKIN